MTINKATLKRAIKHTNDLLSYGFNVTAINSESLEIINLAAHEYQSLKDDLERTRDGLNTEIVILRAEIASLRKQLPEAVKWDVVWKMFDEINDIDNTDPFIFLSKKYPNGIVIKEG